MERATGDLALAAVAARQRGLVTDEDVAAAALTRRAVRHRLATGRWRRLHLGVYLVGVMTPPLAGELAAVLTCRPNAYLSHAAASSLLELLRPQDAALDVTVAGREVRRAGLCIHTVAHLDPRETTVHRGVPTTTAARTLLDLAAAGHPGLDRAWSEALVTRRASPRQITTLLDRHAGRPGTVALRALLDHERAPSVTRSEAERRLLDLIQAARLPRPRTNTRVGPYEVDALWPDHELIVEVDGYAFHRTRRAFERDRRRDSDLAARGFLTVRLSWHQLADEPEATIARLAAALARRG